MSSIPFFLRRARTADPHTIEASVVDEATPSAVTSRRRLALDVFRYVLLTVVGPAAAVLAVAAVLAN